MNVETGAEAKQFPGKEYIIGIAFAVCTLLYSTTKPTVLKWFKIMIIKKPLHSYMTVTVLYHQFYLNFLYQQSGRDHVSGMDQEGTVTDQSGTRQEPGLGPKVGIDTCKWDHKSCT